MIINPGSHPEQLRGVHRDHCLIAAGEIAHAFDWSKTAEGTDFWTTLCKRLRDIGNGNSSIYVCDPQRGTDGDLKPVPYRALSAAEHLRSAFEWGTTREGYDFWASINARLLQLSAEGRSAQLTPPW